MTKIARIAALLVALLPTAVPCLAQDALAKRLSLDLKAMAPASAFKVIADAVGYSVDVAPDVTTPVDIVVRNITVKTALNTVCESIGCKWEAAGRVISVRTLAGLVLAARGPRGERGKATRTVDPARLAGRLGQQLPPDMKFENAPLAEVAERLSKATGLAISISGDTPPGLTFSADLGNRPFSAALMALSQQLKGNVVCRIGLRDEGGGIDRPVIAIQIGTVVQKERR